MKRCTKCGEEKPLGEFYCNSRGRLNSECKSCTIRCAEAWRQRNRNRVLARKKEYRQENAEKIREDKLKRRYGITLSDYYSMLDAQGGVCKLCSGDNGEKRLHVDHDHNTGRVRGLLCSRCNIELGRIKDNPIYALKLYKYLAPMGGLEHLFEIKQMAMEL